MRKILYIIILLALLFAPVKRLDVAKLMPIEALAIYTDGEEIVVETDSEDVGRGKTIEEAVVNLKESADQIIYLDTAEYLLVAEDLREETQKIIEYLKADIKIRSYQGGEIKEEAAYLDAHDEAGKPKG